jgi:endonuclease YncB( thermonuclease family)
VVAVADGDTITVLDGANQHHRIRLNGIDAPESGQAFSNVSKSHLAELVAEREVIVVGTKIDRHGRLVGTVIAGSTNANLEQLRAGLAWYYREYAADVSPENRPLYEAAEAEARAARLGLWRDPSPQPPWVYRRQSSGLSAQAAVSAPSATAPARAPTPARPLGLAGTPTPAARGRVIGNRNSRIYHVPGCRSYNAVAERNRVYFNTEEEARAAGFRKARNCN